MLLLHKLLLPLAALLLPDVLLRKLLPSLAALLLHVLLNNKLLLSLAALLRPLGLLFFISAYLLHRLLLVGACSSRRLRCRFSRLALLFRP